MLGQEILAILEQFGGGRGDPGNAVVRFLLPSFFWSILAYVAMRQWGRHGEKRDLFVAVAAAVALCRELTMFLLEYGTLRGFLPVSISFAAYPPLEHALTGLGRVLLGFAFLTYYFPERRIGRHYLIAGTGAFLLLYLVTAPLWIDFLKANRELFTHRTAHFGMFWGDMGIHVVGSAATAMAVAVLALAGERGRKVPKSLYAALLLLFLDDFLMIVNLASGDVHKEIYGPIRHNLAIWAIPLFIAVYWGDLQNRVEEEKARSEGILTATGDGITIQDLDLRVIYQNPIHRAAMGDRVGELCYAAYRGLSVPCDDCPVLLAFKDGRTHSVERNRTLPGGTVFVELTANVLRDASGRIVAGIGVVHDISIRKRLEEQFHHSQRMEAVGRLAGGVAHDFNNLLTAILGYCDILQWRTGSRGPGHVEVEEIRKAAERASTLTGRLLAFSRRQVLSPKVLDLREVIAGMEKMLRRLIEESIDLVLVPGAGKGRVRVDPAQIEQVVMNLVVNARDAMPHGGRLVIETGDVRLTQSVISHPDEIPPGDYAKLSVADTGCGMDKETMSRLFEPFFTTKEKGKGTGLGLSTVYGIVRQSGGYIGVTSAPGKGSVFGIFLPRIPSSSEEGKAPGRARGGKETVLLAEDEESVRHLVREILAKKGYTVIAVADGQEALEAARSHPRPIHLLLTDVVMPGLDGRRLAELVKGIRPEIKVLYMSGYVDRGFDPLAISEHGVHFLPKPFSPDALALKVRETLDA